MKKKSITGKQLLAFLLSMIMILSLLPASVFADTLANPQIPELTLGEPVSVQYQGTGESYCFSYTPQVSDNYCFYSYDNSDEGFMPEVYLYADTAPTDDNNGDYIAQNSYGGDDGNFALFYDLEAGRTYFFRVYYGADDSISCSAVLKESCTVTYHANTTVNPDAFTYYDDWDIYQDGPDFTMQSAPGLHVKHIDLYSDDEEGYWKFAGWSLSEDANEADIEAYTDETVEITGDTDLYAVWKPRYADVTFNGNGYLVYNEYQGYYEDSFSRRCDIGDDIWDFPDEFTPQYRIREFEGWFTQKEGGELVETPYEVTGDTTLYAHWSDNPITEIGLDEEQTIRFSGAGKEVFFFSFTPAEDGIYKYIGGSEDEEESPEIQIFDEANNHAWRTDYSNSLPVELTAGTKYYIRISGGYWQYDYSFKITMPETVNVTYHTTIPGTYFDEEGKPQTIIIKKAVKDSLYIDYPKANDENLQFQGWVLSPEITDPEEIVYTVGEEDMEVYALWKRTCTVTFHANGPAGTRFWEDWVYDEQTEEEKQVDVTEISRQLMEGSDVSEYYERPTYTDDTKMFAGWAREANASEPEKPITVTRDMDVYAVWKEKCDVTFDINTTPDIGYFVVWDEYDNEQHLSTVQKSFPKGTKLEGANRWLTNYEILYDEDYYFLGWSVDPNAVAPDESITVKEGMTIYGVWKKAYAKVTFNANGGYFGEDPDEKTLKASYDIGETFFSYSTPVHSDPLMFFIGWFDDKNGGVEYVKDKTIINDDVTLYAHWKKVTPSTLELNKGQMVSSQDGPAMLEFTPAESGTYKFYSYDRRDKYLYPAATLYLLDSGKLAELGSDAYGRGNVNFQLYGNLEAGRKYYLKVFGSRDEKDFAFGVIVRKANTCQVTFHLGTSIEDAYFLQNDRKSETLTIEAARGSFVNLYDLYSGSDLKIENKNLSLYGWSEYETSEDTEMLIRITSDTDLYAVWQNMYEVTLYVNNEKAYFYDDEGNRVSSISDIYYSRGGFARDEEPWSSNKYFLGWSLDPNATQRDEKLAITQDGTRVYAVWADYTEITFHTNNANVKYSGGSDSAILKTRVGSIIYQWTMDDFTVTDPTMALVGWSTDKNASEAQPITVTKETKDVYGVWKPAVTVTLDANKEDAYFSIWDDEEETNLHEKTISMSVVSGAVVDPYYEFESPYLEDSSKVRFAGWALSADAAEPISGEVTITEDTKFYAVWKPRVTITFVANHPSAYYYVDEETGEGYQKKESISVQYSAEAYVWPWTQPPRCDDDSVAFAGYSLEPGSDEVIGGYLTESTTVYGVWKKACTVTLHTNNKDAWFSEYEGIEEESDIKKVKVVQGESISLYNYGEYEGLYSDPSITLTGWSKSASSAKEGSFVFDVNKDMDLFGIWAKTVFVTLDPNMDQGGYFMNYEHPDKRGFITRGFAQGEELYPFTVVRPKNENADTIFDYWSDEKGNPVTYPLVLNEDIVLRANWKTVHPTGIQTETPVTVTLKNGESVWYKFTIPEDGNYVIRSSASGSVDPYGKYYAENEGTPEIINEDDNGNGNLDFRLIIYAEKGDTFLLEAGAHQASGTASYNVIVEKVEVATVRYYANHEKAHYDRQDVGGRAIVWYKTEIIGESPVVYPPLLSDSDEIEFLGYSRDEKATKPDDSIIVDGDMSLYAVWAKVNSKTVLDNKNTTVTIADQTYDGTEKTPEAAVVYNGKTELVLNKDYTISFGNNKNAGQAEYTVTGIGAYTGSVSGHFTINQAEQKLTLSATKVSPAVGASKSVKVTGAKGKLSYKSSSTAYVKVAATSTGCKITGVKVGSKTVTVTAAASKDGNYKEATAKITVKVVPAAPKTLKAENLSTGVKATWTASTGATGYKVSIYSGSKLIQSKTLSKGLTYTFTKAKTNGTKYTVKLVPTASTGSGTEKSLTHYYLTKPATPGVTSKTAKKATVTWKKNANGSGYEIRYSLKSSMSGSKTVKAAKASTVSKVISGLTSKKTYYFQVRAYKTVSGKTYYSAWSSSKSVKVK